MNINIPSGVWPTMITPFRSNIVDFPILGKLVEWYLENDVDGLFAVCQSSEMFNLTLEERLTIAEFVKEKASGKVPVIASGNISETIDEQAEEIKRMHQTGVDAVVLLTNRFAEQYQSDDIWKRNMEKLLDAIPRDIPLGFYECPHPYKRVLSPELLKWCADTGRFYFLKDTSCDIDNIKGKLISTKNTGLKIFNANTATLLESLKAGGHGYSGVMANFHPDLYVWMCESWIDEPETSQHLQEFLSMCALIERQLYPVNAKYYLTLEGVFDNYQSRAKNERDFSNNFKMEVQQLHNISKLVSMQYVESNK